MRLEENYEDITESRKGNTMLIGAVAAVCLLLAVVIGIVIWVNRDKFVKTEQPVPSGVVEEEESGPDLDALISGSTLVSSDLDIWDDYADEDEPEESFEEPSEEEEADENAGKTLIERADGTTEWVPVSKYMPQNVYDRAGFAMLDGRMYYYEEGACISFTGVEISKSQGYVDYNEVKRDGVDYAIIRLGQRGYTTGQLTLDDYYADNMKRATDAGLDVGVSFYSQAITLEEAEEEAEMVLQYLEGYEVRYPVVFHMEHIENEVSRIDGLTKEEKTRIANAFLAKIEAAGYVGMIKADKEWLFDDINYAALSNYQIWLDQHKDLPDYPYRFGMWNYTGTGAVDGIEGSVNLSISFMDYSLK